MWKTRGSDYAYCEDWFGAVAASSLLPPLLDKSCPTYSIMRQLKDSGHSTVSRTITHSAHNSDDLVIDGSQAFSKKFYFQVLLDLPKHLALCDPLPSNQPQNFYKLLLRGEEVRPRLGDKEYKRLIALGDGDDVVHDLVPVANEVAVEDLVVRSDTDSDICVAGGRASLTIDDKQQEEGGGLVDPGPASDAGGDGVESEHGSTADPEKTPSGHAASSDGSQTSDSESAEESGCDITVSSVRRKFNWYEVPGGGRISLQYYQPRSRTAYKRWQLFCGRDCHGRCSRYRSVSTGTCKHFGILEPVAFLMVWRDLPLKAENGILHRRAIPALVAMKAWLDENAESFLRDSGIDVHEHS